MSEKTDINVLTNTAIVYVNAKKTETKRAIAVLAAMELIKSDLTTSGSGTRMQGHMASLSEYADQIEAALNKE